MYGNGRNDKNHKNNKNDGSNGNDRNERAVQEDIFVGRNAVTELLKSGTADKILMQSGDDDGPLKIISALALQKGVPVVRCDRRKLDSLSNGVTHQGVAAYASQTEYKTVDDILQIAKDKGEKPFIVICDSVEDPHNLGAIIRTAECAGVHGVIIPKRRGVSVNGTVAKASAGALFHMAIARVPNLAAAVDELKQNGVWVWALEADGECCYDSDFDCGCALILGGENNGVSELLRKKADYVVSIPMFGKINSLNVSAAGAVMMFEAAKQKHNKNA